MKNDGLVVLVVLVMCWTVLCVKYDTEHNTHTSDKHVSLVVSYFLFPHPDAGLQLYINIICCKQNSIKHAELRKLWFVFASTFPALCKKKKWRFLY